LREQELSARCSGYKAPQNATTVALHSRARRRSVSASLDNALTQMTLAQCRFAIPNQHNKARERQKNLGRGNVLRQHRSPLYHNLQHNFRVAQAF